MRGAGVLIGMSLACTAAAIAMSVAARQLGSFLGAYGGGLIYDQLGSYTQA